eukprot:301625-Chlamydomonas_euryale.AAC.1
MADVPEDVDAESLDHTHSTHRCCRSCLEPCEGLVLGNSSSACHYPGARSRSALQDSRKLLARHREYLVRKLVPGWGDLARFWPRLEAAVVLTSSTSEVDLGRRGLSNDIIADRRSPSGSSGEPPKYIFCIQDDIDE